MARRRRPAERPRSFPSWVTTPVIDIDPAAPPSQRQWQAWVSWSRYARRVEREYPGEALDVMHRFGTSWEGFRRLAIELPEDRAVDDRAVSGACRPGRV